jgi:uncharacterized protein (DUF433 family)
VLDAAASEEESMANLKVASSEPVPLRIEADGTVRVGKTRVTLDILVGAYNMGYSAEKIARSYSTLQLADIYAVLSYYLRHREEVDAFLQDRQQEAEDLRSKIEELCPPDGFRERLLARRLQQTKT